MRWEEVVAKNEMPHGREDHSADIFEAEKCMIVFGGFVKGTMTNKVLKFFFNEKKWEEIKITGN